jgi:hypothetical protein
VPGIIKVEPDSVKVEPGTVKSEPASPERSEAYIYIYIGK